MVKWIVCPFCGKKLCRVDTEHETTLYLWCKKCKKEVVVSLKGEPNEPDARTVEKQTES